MSKLIIVCGLPGAGKTTIAQKLSQKLKMFCLHKDSIKEQLYESSGGATLEDSKRLSLWSAQILLRIAAENVERGIDMMIEAPFHFEEDYALFRQWEQEYGVQIIAIVVSVDEGERQRRYVQRAHGSRHKAHHDEERILQGNGQATASQASYDKLPGKKIHVSTDNRQADDIVAEIVAQMKEVS